MITIKKDGKEFHIPSNDFLALQDTSDGLYFKFKDGCELRIPCEVTSQIKAIPSILMKSTAKLIVLDFKVIVFYRYDIFILMIFPFILRRKKFFLSICPSKLP